MIENFEINSKEIDKIKKISKEERDFRINNLNLFNKKGFPNKKQEDWKFSDLREIVRKNFKKLNVNKANSEVKKVSPIKDFDHNYIVVVNGKLNSSNFKFEEKNKISIKNFQNDNFLQENKDNPLICLNHALSEKGYHVEVEDNYKFKKALIIYNLFTKDLKDNILNSRNKIKIGKNSELHTIDLVINDSKYKFINNVYENIILENNAVYKSICIQNDKSEGYFHKFSKNKLSSKSKYSSFIFPSGLKFNKLDLEFNLEGKDSECIVQSASFLNKNDHQEIKTRMNHLAPSCKSYQKVKNVLSSDGQGVYQGKIYVKDIAQKTNAYQLSKALLLSDSSEFNSKPELEIYADDVKCSHGATSGSVDEDSIYYLMTRGLNRKEAVKLLIDGFLNEVVDMIKSNSVKKFVKRKLEEQIHKLDQHLLDKESILRSTPTILPTNGWITSYFGHRISPTAGVKKMHEGLDVGANFGTEILAPADGIVTFAGRKAGFGLFVQIDHGYGIETIYAHSQKIITKSGNKVKRGDLIAKVGSTGASTGPHLHYEVRINGTAVDPLYFVLE